MSEKILATVAADDFVGRSVEIESLLRHAEGKTEKRALLILSAPIAGAGEILKQTYDRLFQTQTELIPVYFAVKNSDKTAKNCAARFLQTLLAQITAFRHRNPQILKISPDVYELVEIASPEDKNWIEPLIKNSEREGKLNDERVFVKNFLNAPLRASLSGAKIFLMIDALDEAGLFTGEIDFVEQLKEILTRFAVPFVVCGKRRFLLDALSGENSIADDAKILRVEPLEIFAAGKLIENLAGKFDVAINEQTRDLIARQTCGRPLFIKFFFEAANEKKANLDEFQLVEKIYANEIFGGRFKRFYDAAFQKITGDVELQKAIIDILYNLQNRRVQNGAFDFLKEKLNLNSADFYRMIASLNISEITRRTANGIEPMSEDVILNDCIAARFRLEIEGENRAAIVGETLAAFIKRAPHLMANHYRADYALNLRELLTAFDSQETPVGFLDYSIFKERFKGLEEAEIFDRIAADGERVYLPQIVYAAHTAAFYPSINQVVETERSAIAFGFDERKYTDADETIWIAAEIDSKLEASRETVEFWCDRLEMVALNCNFRKYKLWLVAPEGFTPEASEVLRQQNAFGSSRQQIGLLAKFLDAENSINTKADANEYEIVVPMGEDTELIAAHTIEDIARRYSFDPKAVNQIKTALIEACINATEHSLSPDRKIYQKFTIESDKITIKISNRGLRIADKQATEFVPNEGRRGWGLKLMRSLMDEVKFEQVDDGTRISMTKYFQKS